MSEEAVVPTHVLRIEAVRWAIEQLGHRRIHPAFIYYLYLRMMHVRGSLHEASASSEEVLTLLRMPGGPEGRPYYRPLRERGNREGMLLRSFWMQPNVAGSWSPASLRRIAPASWLVSYDDYVLPDDHAALAKEKLLFDDPVSVVALGAYFLRNDGFLLNGPGTAGDLIEAFRTRFRFDENHEAEFTTLFDVAEPEVDFDWFESVPSTGITGSPGRAASVGGDA